MVFYTVRSGDTLSGIAARFGVALADLEAANHQVTDANNIIVGQVLAIPDKRAALPADATTPGTYVVQSGDTMSGIAARFGVTLDALAAANPQVTDRNRISVGQVLAIPGGHAPFLPLGDSTPAGIPDQLARWLPLIQPAAHQFALKPSIILGVMQVESAGHNVIGDGGHGHGLMQIDDRSFADWLAQHANGMDPASNIMFGASLLRQNIDFFNGDLRAGIAAYNCGPGTVQNALATVGDPDAFTTGHNYSRTVLALADSFAAADAGGATMIDGIDVSNNNRNINWDQAATTRVQFAIAKVSEGVDFADKFFAQNWAEMKRLAFVRGAYHFARPSANDADAEAEQFLTVLNAAGGLEPGDFVALDLEDENVGANADLSPWVLQWLEHVEARVGFKPMLYSRTGYLQDHGCTNDTALAQYGLWLAAWGQTPPTAPPVWPFWAIWQFDAAGRVPGIPGDCDLDRFNGTRAQLLRYGKPAS